MFYWSKNLWLPILAHFTNNALAIIFSYQLVAEKVQLDLLNEEIPVKFSAALISLFSAYDEEMISCKSGSWWENNPQRGRANNSAVLFVCFP